MALTLPTEQIETRQLTLAAAAVLPKKKKEKTFTTKSNTPTFFSAVNLDTGFAFFPSYNYLCTVSSKMVLFWLYDAY